MQEDGKKPEEEKRAEMPAGETKSAWKHKHFVAGLPMVEVILENGQKVIT